MQNFLLQGKKGIGIQFNWIFVLIGGAVILGFFVSLVVNQSAETERKSAQQATTDLDGLLRASLAASNTLKITPFSEKVTFSCDETSEFSVKGAFRPSRYDYNAIFTPRELDGKELIISSLTFEAPFKVMTVLYITNRDIEYVFMGSSKLLGLAYAAMPENTTKKKLSPSPDGISTYPDNNFDSTVFVVDDSSYLKPLDDFKKKAEQVSGIVLINGSSGPLYGNAFFYNYSAASPAGFELYGSTPFFSPEFGSKTPNMMLVLGAIITHDKGMYECNLNKILKQYGLLIGLHKKRLREQYAANDASGEPKAPSYCWSYYIPTPGDTDAFEPAENYLQKINESITEASIAAEGFKPLVLAINKLVTVNDYLLKSTDCPRIY